MNNRVYIDLALVRGYNSNLASKVKRKPCENYPLYQNLKFFEQNDKGLKVMKLVLNFLSNNYMIIKAVYYMITINIHLYIVYNECMYAGETLVLVDLGLRFFFGEGGWPCVFMRLDIVLKKS